MRAIDSPNIRQYSGSYRRRSWREDIIFRYRAEYKEEEPYMTDYYDMEDTLSLQFQNSAPWDNEAELFMPNCF